MDKKKHAHRHSPHEMTEIGKHMLSEAGSEMFRYLKFGRAVTKDIKAIFGKDIYLDDKFMRYLLPHIEEHLKRAKENPSLLEHT